jgi:hypothetical protein
LLGEAVAALPLAPDFVLVDHYEIPGLVTALVAGETDETAPLVVMIGWSSPTPVTGDPGAVQSRLSRVAADAGGIGRFVILESDNGGLTWGPMSQPRIQSSGDVYFTDRVIPSGCPSESR